jgi:hypothetical protein
MSYTKPEIRPIGSSLTAIKDSSTPKQCFHPDSHDGLENTTAGAYEADE